MWCTTECWNCEDKTCEHYISKQDIYFKYKQSQSNWNSLRELVDYQLKHNVGSSAESSIRNHVYLEIRDKMNELESKNV